MSRTPQRRTTRHTCVLPEAHPLYPLARHFCAANGGETLSQFVLKWESGELALEAEDRDHARAAFGALWTLVRGEYKKLATQHDTEPVLRRFKRVCVKRQKTWIAAFSAHLADAEKERTIVHDTVPKREFNSPPTDKEWLAADAMLEFVLSALAERLGDAPGASVERTLVLELAQAFGATRGQRVTARWLTVCDDLRDFRLATRVLHGFSEECTFGIETRTPFDFAPHPELAGHRGMILSDFAVPLPFLGTGFARVLRAFENALARSTEYTLLFLEYVHRDMFNITVGMGAEGYAQWLALDDPTVRARDAALDALLDTPMGATDAPPQWHKAYNDQYGTDPAYDIVYHVYWLSPFGRALARARAESLALPVAQPLRPRAGAYPAAGVVPWLRHFAGIYWAHADVVRPAPEADGDGGPRARRGYGIGIGDDTRTIRYSLDLNPANQLVFAVNPYVSPLLAFADEPTRPMQLAYVLEVLRFVSAAVAYHTIGEQPAELVLVARFIPGAHTFADDARAFIDGIDTAERWHQVRTFPERGELVAWLPLNVTRTGLERAHA
jgi:hypothetical protein